MLVCYSDKRHLAPHASPFLDESPASFVCMFECECMMVYVGCMYDGLCGLYELPEVVEMERKMVDMRLASLPF